MSNSSPPGQRPPHLRDDEPIALLIAFLSFGAIFLGILNLNQGRFSIGNFLTKAGETQAPQVITTPLPQTTETEIEAGAGTGAEINGGVEKAPRLDNSPQPPVPNTGVVTTPGNPVAINPSPMPSIAPSPTPIPSASLTPAKPGGAPLSFVDVPKTYWAYPFITALSAQGIIGGYPDGTFKPDQPVKRSEFAIQIQKAYAKPNTLPPIAFVDVPQNDQLLPAIDQAVKMNFMSGYPDKTFRPSQKVSRLEAAVSMARGFALPTPSDPEAILQGYVDQNQIPEWARSRMAAAVQAGLVSGDPDTKQLKPNQSASRSDIAALVYKGQKLVAK